MNEVDLFTYCVGALAAMDAHMDNETVLMWGAWALLNIVQKFDELMVHRLRGVKVGLKAIVGCSSFIQAAKDKANKALTFIDSAAP